MMSNHIASIPCPSCQQASSCLIGQIPLTKIFAGRIEDTATLSSSLYRCDNCRVLFRWPRLSIDETARLYRFGNTGGLLYQHENRQEWIIARQWLENNTPINGSILDAGCFDGEFLTTLTGKWERYGVELDQLAVKRAEQKGIKIIANDVKELKNQIHKGSFGTVVAMDVIEHMENPSSFLKDLFEIACPGGNVIISSGDTNAWTWRFMGSQYWYSLYSDHISFINEAWCRRFAEEQNAEVLHIERFSHADSTDHFSFYMDMLKNTVYRISPELFAFLRRHGAGGINVEKYPELISSPPLWRTARDHIIVCFRKSKH
jgi:2-polyprenyl-3-methyl-5-hydroxy-6-metoxy-1,4-benzoquinol methylase